MNALARPLFCLYRRLFLCLLWLAAPAALQAAPPMLLAGQYTQGVDVAQYWVSEKYDGVRAWWDGARLQTRGGQPIAAPDWFTEGWPRTVMEGELWGGRGTFEAVSGAVRSTQPDDEAWRAIRLMVFDLPEHPGTFNERLRALQQLHAAQPVATWQPVPQWRGTTHAALMADLQKIVSGGGEGVMLHRGDSHYRAGRGDDLLKLKPADDAEAIVRAHLPGKGKYTGMTGALLVEREADGARFRIGSGLTDELRRHPPPPGTVITYRYNGLTRNGLPRFPRLWRIHTPAPAPEKAAPALP